MGDRGGRRSRSRSPPRRRSRSPRSPPRGGGGGGKSDGRGLSGVASRWNERGFGFIRPDNGGEDIFCHFSAITDGNCLREGDPVTYDVGYDNDKKKERAENVRGGSSEDRSAGKAGECYDFRDGVCRRGDSCKFTHSGGGRGGGGRGGGDRRGGGGYDDRRDGRRDSYRDDRRDSYRDDRRSRSRERW